MEATAEPGAEPEKKPQSKTKIIAAIAVVLVLGAGAAGAVVGPKLLSRSHAKKAAPAPSAEPAEAVGETAEFAPIVVDTRAEDGTIHHLKVVVAVELPETTKKEEFTKYAPRGREAAITYLRSEPFEVISSPQKFEEVRKELSKRILEAVGEKRIARVLITDFVAQ